MADQVTIQPVKNGPLIVKGPAVLLDPQGQPMATGEQFALCRCGQSASKPLCDGSHKRVGFQG